MENHIPSVFTIITDSEFEESKKLVDAETGEIVLEGDYYHDKIDEQIVGFLHCMDFFGYPYTLEKSSKTP